MSSHDSPQRTLFVACVLCVVCSIVVSSSAVLLRETQQNNKLLDKQRNILVAAGLLSPNESASSDDIGRLFANIDIKYVDFETGDYVTPPVDHYDQRRAAKVPDQSVALSANHDIAGIKRRARIGIVYLAKAPGGAVERIILPVHGYGLWSTLYGFLALDTDAKTVQALSFYEHAETPGLGGEVDNPQWKRQWAGKTLFSAQGEVAIELYKGQVTENTPNAQHKFDALAGATLTSKGVENLVAFWVGPSGFGPYLKQMQASKIHSI